jgi:hypothetical protein
MFRPDLESLPGLHFNTLRAFGLGNHLNLPNCSALPENPTSSSFGGYVAKIRGAAPQSPERPDAVEVFAAPIINQLHFCD